MVDFSDLEVWFVTGSQHLYGEKVLQQVWEHAQIITSELDQSRFSPVKIIPKPVLTNPDAIVRLCTDANSAKNCVGLITWMHTFSPAKMWIAGLRALRKPLLHMHTQFNRDIPWNEIDMDFMNLNQSAHGDREYGFIGTRMRLNRKVLVGHWQDERVLAKLEVWLRAACAWHDLQGAKIARFGDNMREVAVTEGDKVEAQIQWGYSVNGYGVGDLAEYVSQVTDSDINSLVTEYDNLYEVDPEISPGGELRMALREAARIESGMRNFLEAGGFKAFTTTFEDLHGLAQLPGLAVQRLMADGYGFGAEGDWKTAAMVRAMKVMSAGMEGGTSFMEDYTYHLEPRNMKVLGAHMLEVCPSIGDETLKLEIHPLSIGSREDPPRLVFNVRTGPALNVSVIDMGNRFRIIVNEVEVVQPDAALPKLPVARVVWNPKPNLKSAAEAWILAGGAHHTSFSQAVTSDYLENFAEIAGMEFLLIDEALSIADFKKELRWNEMYYHLAKGL